MFFASKLLAFVTQPVCWAVLLLFAGLLLQRRRAGLARKLNVASLAILLSVGWMAPIEALLHSMESLYPGPPFDADLKPYVGIVVLGGAMDQSRSWDVPGRISLNAAAERMMVPVGLMQRNQHLELLFTGGSGELEREALTEADRAKIIFDSLGVDPSRTRYENASRTTYENAVLSAKVAGIDISKPWLLLTTAAHMPRSMAVFRKQGWNVTAYPVDFRGSGKVDWLRYDMGSGVEKWHYALHEIIGYAMYRATGRL